MEFPGVSGLLEFPRDLKKICEISRGGGSFCLEFPSRGKVKKKKNSSGVSKKYVL